MDIYANCFKNSLILSQLQLKDYKNSQLSVRVRGACVWFCIG